MVKTNLVIPWTAVLLLGISSLVACSDTQQAPARPQPGSATPQPASAPSPASASSPAPSAGLAATQGEFPGITVAVQELKRSSNNLTLKLVMTNQSSQGFGTYNYFAETEGSSVDGVHLIDPVGKKKYFVIRDTGGACLCSRQVQAISPGAQSVLWAKFPAPPDDVQKMTVEIPHFPPLEDVPVSR